MRGDDEGKLSGLAAGRKLRDLYVLGRPRKRWKEGVDEALRRRGTSLIEVEEGRNFDDRDGWRQLLRMLPPDKLLSNRRMVRGEIVVRKEPHKVSSSHIKRKSSVRLWMTVIQLNQTKLESALSGQQIFFQTQ